MQWSGEPALHTRFHFGKYRGQRFEAIAATDPDYLRWIVEKSELEEGIKHSARHWLAAAANQIDVAGVPPRPFPSQAQRTRLEISGCWRLNKPATGGDM